MKKWRRLLAALAGMCLVLFGFVGCGGGGGQVRIGLDSETILLEGIGSVRLLRATVENSEEEVTWSSSDPSVAAVEKVAQGGRVTAVAPGFAVVTASVGEAKAECRVTVQGAANVPTLSLSHAEVSVYPGGSLRVQAQVQVGTDVTAVTPTFETDDPAIATVAADGTVTGVAYGETELVATVVYDGETLEERIPVLVKDQIYFVIEQADVRLAMVALNAGEISEKQLTLAFRVNDEAQTPEGVQWSSSAPSIVSVADGEVSAGTQKGFSEITASLTYDSKTYTATTEVETYKARTHASARFEDVDLSTGTLGISLDDLGMTSAQSAEVTIDETVCEANISGGTLTVNTQGVSYGEREIAAEFSDRIVTADAFFVTKILRDKEDVLGLVELAGGRDAAGAYDGYFVLGDNIDLEGEKVGAPFESSRSGVQGFQGIFDGRGFMLENGEFSDHGGLFGAVGSKGVVKNLALSSALMNPSESTGNGILAYYIFGRVENVHISCTLAGGYVASAALSYAAAGAEFRNIVVEMTYTNTRVPNPNGTNNMVLVGYLPDSASVFENVYAISNHVWNGEVIALDINKNNTCLYEEIGNGIVTYLPAASGMTFTGLDPEIWTVPASGVPFFTKTGARSVYKVRHYVMKAETGSEWVMDAEESFLGLVGGSVTATPKSYRDRVFRMDKAPAGKTEANKGVVPESGTLVLECYYRNAWSFDVDRTTGTTANLPQIEMNGSPDNGHQFLDYLGTFEGQRDVWKFTTMALDDGHNNRLSLRWIEPDEMEQYSFFECKLYAEDWSKVDVVSYYGGSGYNTNLGDAAQVAARGGMIRIYDLEGNPLEKAANGQWILFRYCGWGNAENSILKFGNLAAGNSTYFADAKLAIAPYPPEMILEEEEATVAAKGEPAQILASLIVGWQGQKAEDPNFSYRSADENVAVVSEDGRITGVARGTTTITVSIVYGGVTLTKTVDVTVLNEMVDTSKDFGDVDLSVGTLSIDLAEDFGASGYAGALPKVTVGGVECPATLESGVLTVTVANAAFGTQEILVETDTKTYRASALFVTKILRTVADVQSLSAGFDASTQSYTGYFVLGSNIDLGTATISATTDSDGMSRAHPEYGFRGTFDGRGYVLGNGVYTFGGLFGTVANTGVVKNLAIFNADLNSSGHEGSGVIARKFFGTADNIYLSGTVRSGTYNSVGFFSASALNATIKNTVVEAKYRNTRPERNSNATFIGYTPGVTLQNVYVISDRTSDGRAEAFGTADPCTYNADGIKVWLPTATDMAFTGLDSAIWETPAGEVPRFKKEAGFVAAYSVQHYTREATVDGTPTANAFTVRETTTERGVIGSTVTDFGKVYPDRVFNMASNNAPSGKTAANTGTVTQDGSLVLECYYSSVPSIAVAAGTTFNMNGSPRDGTAILDLLETFEGKNNVWRMTSTGAGGASRLTFANMTQAAWANYEYLEFKIYAQFSNLDFVPVLNGAYDNSGATTNPANVTKVAESLTFYDESGTQLSVLTDNTWVTVRVTKCNASGQILMFGNLTSAGRYYVCDAKLVAKS